MKYLYKLSEGLDVSWPGIKLKSQSESADFARASAARIWVDGRHGKIYSEAADRVYLVLDGNGYFEIEGERYEVTKTDVVIVPKLTKYDYGGKMELFLVHTPAFDRTKEHNLEHR
jgi:gentisate 1,2-dioxygenase